MRKIVELEVSALQPGLELAAAVTDAAGRVLLPAGAVLSASAIEGLARRQVGSVAIYRQIDLDPETLAASKARIAGQLDHLFRKAGDGQATRSLYDAVLAYRLQEQS